MKRMICAVLAVFLAASSAIFAHANDIDLSSMSWQELIDLRAAISAEMAARPEWQSVTVPKGIWIVGEDIPAGKWTIRNGSGLMTRVEIGAALNDQQTGIRFGGYYVCVTASGDETSVIDLADGYFVVIGMGDAVFEPYTGKPDLGFRN